MSANPLAYYECVNPELLRQLPRDARLVVEIGCGAAALAQQLGVAADPFTDRVQAYQYVVRAAKGKAAEPA
jgi:hypothetical protein